MKMKVKDFDLGQTLECGQCFNFEKIDENEYAVIAHNRLLHVRQEGDDLIFLNSSEEDIKNVWIHYFDLDRDYSEIKKRIIEADSRLGDIINEYYGIHILNQEFPETLISFIISQNKNIPQIKKIVRAICDRAGEELGTCGPDNMLYHGFPSLEKLFEMTEDDFRDLKTGFRAPYIMNAIEKMKEQGFDGQHLSSLSYEEAKAKLTEIKGVGDKVANCVLLFSLGFRDAFPVDVWIKRIMEELYFEGDTPKTVIEEFAADKFGELGGYAQQYLFIYAKNKV